MANADEWGNPLPEFSEHTRRLHRNVVAISYIILASAWLHVSLADAKVFGVSFEGSGANSIMIGLLLLLLYNLGMYGLMAFSEISERVWGEVVETTEQRTGVFVNLQELLRSIGDDNVNRQDQLGERLDLFEEQVKRFPGALRAMFSVVRFRQRVEIGAAAGLGVLAFGHAVWLL